MPRYKKNPTLIKRNFYLPKELDKALRMAAARREVSRSFIVTHAIAAALEAKENKTTTEKENG